MKYENIFSKGKIGNVFVKNRVVMSPMSVGLGDKNGNPTHETIAYYEERAKGGVGLIMLGALKINDEHGTIEANQLSIAHDGNMKYLKKLVDRVHKYDTRVFAQIAHPGRQTFSSLNGGRQVVAPSPIACIACREEPRELSIEEIKNIVKDFVKGAVRLKTIGMDGVELHGAHGYLINQFLSPYTNKRKDVYGGSFENRMRFITEIIKGIKENCGVDYPMSVRISVDEFLHEFGIYEEGIDIKEGVKISKYLESLGIDAINVSSGVYATTNTIIEPISYPQGWRKSLIKAVKEQVHIPVIGAMVIRKPSFAEKVLKEGVVDFVALGRGLIADPYWVHKLKFNSKIPIRPCISCLHCIESVLHGKRMECAVNPMAGKETKYLNIKKDGQKRVVAVIGAGPSGIEAAKVLSLRGFELVLFEMKDKIGGQLQLANKPPHKEKITWLIDYMTNEMKRLHIPIKLNTKATLQNIKKLNLYAVCIATGGMSLKYNIEGIDKENVYTIEEILKEEIELKNKKIAIIGSGMSGLEVGEFLGKRGNQVFIIEMLHKIGQGIYTPNRLDMIKRLKKYNVEMIPNHKLEKIIDGKIMIRNIIEDKIVQKEIDHVVLSMGVKPNDTIVEEIKKNFNHVKVIGDANTVGRIYHAVHEGFMAGYNL
ncbi:FAD-dependent oxidoreductase [Inediibacterium massiliense]|uniref:oxidoreductase n=1 Tax=Inediibacterium massiliense TaxID=1658111 RepID=UPI0006B61ECC|nr:FAD-dependent oxidoreductase [Inediibacterium massiliense]